MPIPSKKNERVLKEVSPGYGSAGQGTEDGGFDLSLLEESLRLTPWQRMLANDEAKIFSESLRAAMK